VARTFALLCLFGARDDPFGFARAKFRRSGTSNSFVIGTITGDQNYPSTGIRQSRRNEVINSMSLILTQEPPPLVSDSDGVVRVGNTRVTLDTVVEAFHEGMTAEAIVEQYPSLQLAEVYSVIGYYLRHQMQVDAYFRDRARFAAQIRQENEARFNPIGVRERLLARRGPQG
jgi:uncharacterized protein (DUF433 family)